MDKPEFPLPRIPLGRALAAMPLEAPDRSAWPLLAEKLHPRRRLPRWPVALAAGLLALAVLPSGWLHEAETPTAATPTQAPTASAQRLELAALMSESARLERLVATASDDGASSGTAAAMSLELEDELRALDAELEANSDPARQLSLWQQRVQLMRDVAAVEASRHYFAAQGGNFDVALVAAY